MNRIQIVCYGLITTAFVLAALVLYGVSTRLESPAEAAVAIARENFTTLTARTRTDEDSLFVIENGSQKLLIYSMDMVHRRLVPVGAADLGSIFSVPGGGAGAGGKPPR